ncbi:MAG: hypothetical protein AMS24_04980 [Chlamydiae bacterium SM23_39]|nr:MAG: hypothetical protein AMS24_04980 [Chlamydiae bacterium SM23_39]
MIVKIIPYRIFNGIRNSNAIKITTAIVLSGAVFSAIFGMTFIPKITKSISFLSSKLHINQIFIKIFFASAFALGMGSLSLLGQCLFCKKKKVYIKWI